MDAILREELLWKAEASLREGIENRQMVVRGLILYPKIKHMRHELYKTVPSRYGLIEPSYLKRVRDEIRLKSDLKKFSSMTRAPLGRLLSIKSAIRSEERCCAHRIRFSQVVTIYSDTTTSSIDDKDNDDDDDCFHEMDLFLAPMPGRPIPPHLQALSIPSPAYEEQEEKRTCWRGIMTARDANFCVMAYYHQRYGRDSSEPDGWTSKIEDMQWSEPLLEEYMKIRAEIINLEIIKIKSILLCFRTQNRWTSYY